MVVVKKKAKNRDRGVAAGANLGLIATVIVAVRGWFKERKHQRELARRKRERKAKRVRFAVKAIQKLTYLLPIIIALLKATRLIVEIRNRKKKEAEKEEDSTGIEVVKSEPVSSEEEVYERVNSETPETEE